MTNKKQGFWGNVKERGRTEVRLMYLYGGRYNSSKLLNVFIRNGLLKYGVFEIPLENITGVSMKHEDQVQEHLKSRLSVTRLALLGPLALAAPKRKIQKNVTVTKYLLIDYVDQGSESTMVFSGEASNRMMSTLKDYLPKLETAQKQQRESLIQTDEPTVPTQTLDPYEEIKKFKELLDMGILTQEEFEQKKKELLGL